MPSHSGRARRAGAPFLWRAPSAPAPRREPRTVNPKIVVIGASTGGPRALLQVLERLPAHCPAPIVIAQHMPPQFTAAMAKWLVGSLRHQDRRGHRRYGARARNRLCRARRNAVSRRQGRAHVAASQGESLYKPSVDILAESAAAAYGGAVLAIMLTGMGNDGARAFSVSRCGRPCHRAGSGARSAVWGMPRAVAESGAADEILGVGRSAGA